MPRQVSPVNLVIDSLLPAELRDPNRVYDKKGIGFLLSEVAKKYPDAYGPLAKALGDLGRDQAWNRGETFRLDDLKPVIDRKPYWDELDTVERAIAKSDLSPEDRNAALSELYAGISNRIQQDTNRAALANRNAVAISVLTGARGKEPQLRDMLSTPGFYPTARGTVVPGFIRRSFAEGLRPSDFLAGMYAARGSVVESKTAVAKGGALSKMLSRAAMKTLVTSKDCGTTNGIALPVDERDLAGRVLQKPQSGYPAGTVITRDVIAKLKKDKPEQVLVRSPMTCEQPEGICSKCFGVLAHGRFPAIGYHAGVTSANAFGEPLAQCLDPETRVRMADGSVKPLRDIQVGDMVLGSSLEGVLRPVRVIGVHRQGVKTTWLWNFKRQHQRLSVRCTSEHKLLQACRTGSRITVPTRGLKPVEALEGRKAYRYNAEIPVGYDDRAGLWVPEARILGLVTGDGCCNGGFSTGGIGLSAYDPSLVADMVDDFAGLGIRLVPQSTTGEWRVSMDQGANEAYQVTNTGDRVRNTLKRILSNVGLWGKEAGDKQLPIGIDQWDNYSVAAYLSGLIATDGWVAARASRCYFGFGSKSRCLVDGVRRLFIERFGVIPSEVSIKRKKRTGSEGGFYDPTHEIVIAGTYNISRIAPLLSRLIPGVKRARMQAVLEAAGAKSRQSLDAVKPLFTGRSDPRDIDTMDISVDHEDHLFVLENWLIVSNSALNLKHVTSGKGGKKEYSGLDVIKQFVESPDEFKDRAVVATVAGVVGRPEAAPQGGWNVRVGDVTHYISPDRTLAVEPGTSLEPGEELTDGLVDPEDILTYRGLGSARNYWTERLSQIARASGAGMDRRNFETLARAIVDHVELDDPVEGGYLPGDRVRLSEYEAQRELPGDTRESPLHQAVGKWLQQPALHYTPGTKLTPKMAEKLGKAGVGKVFVSDAEPDFRPVFIRLPQVATTDDDWLASLGGSYLKNQLAEGVMRAQDTNVLDNAHPVPRLAYGVGYGDRTEETGRF